MLRKPRYLVMVVVMPVAMAVAVVVVRVGGLVDDGRLGGARCTTCPNVPSWRSA